MEVEPPLLHNKVAVYSMRPEIEEKFDAQIEKWKSNGCLQPCEDPGHGIVPLMAVEQPSFGFQKAKQVHTQLRW